MAYLLLRSSAGKQCGRLAQRISDRGVFEQLGFLSPKVEGEEEEEMPDAEVRVGEASPAARGRAAIAIDDPARALTPSGSGGACRATPSTWPLLAAQCRPRVWARLLWNGCMRIPCTN